MKFSEIFSLKRNRVPKEKAAKHWIKCSSCNSLMYSKEVENCNFVCPKCDFHMKLFAEKRIALLCDKDSFVEYDSSLEPTDPLKFVDKKSYKKRIAESYESTEKTSSVISGEGTINGTLFQLVVFDFKFMGGSLGSVEGEKIVRAAKRAIETKSALVIVSASGGARMQESTFALMQMSKTSAAIKMLNDNKIPYISVLTDPTYGGVSASFAWLGDLIIAEPRASIGFAGPRVIKQTVNAELPEGFQSAEFLLQHGLIDAIVERKNMKKYLSDMIVFLSGNSLKKDNLLKVNELKILDQITVN